MLSWRGGDGARLVGTCGAPRRRDIFLSFRAARESWSCVNDSSLLRMSSAEHWLLSVCARTGGGQSRGQLHPSAALRVAGAVTPAQSLSSGTHLAERLCSKLPLLAHAH